MSLADELQKLQQLRDSGALTEEEFQRAKARLIGTETTADDGLLLPRPQENPEKDARQWAFFLHLSQYAHLIFPLGGVVLPIVLWQIKKDEFPVLDAHGKNVVNWSISLFIYLLAAVPLCFILIGIPIVIVLTLAGLICPLIGAVKANNGEIWNYPGAIVFLK